MSEYKATYSGYIAPGETVTDTLEAIFSAHNAEDRPNGRFVRSMSVSDIITLECCGTWFCDSFGFKKID